MARLVTLLYLLSTYASYTLAGNCISSCRDPDDCPPDLGAKWQTCPGKPAKKAQWACQAADIDFPTVDCLAADMRTCGLVGQGGRSTVFYSFGATTKEVRETFRDTLNPKGVMFNDALDDDYWEIVLKARRYRLDLSNRNTVFVARYAEAMAQVSSGEAFIVVENYNGKGGGHGAYQQPLAGDNAPNVWSSYEFPTLQRNPAITKVTSVDLSNKLNQHVDWEPNKNFRLLPASTASALAVPAPAKMLKKRQAASASATCITFAGPGSSTGLIEAASSTTTPISTASKAASITPAPTISCTLQNEDPDQGIVTPYCICSKSTFPVLSVASTATDQGASCDYTTLPISSTFRPTVVLPVVTSNCHVCTIAFDQESCTPLAGCTPTHASPPVISASATPSTVVQLSNNSIHVGDLYGSSLYSAMWSAIKPKCPEATNGPTQCKTDGATIPNVGTIVGETNTEGEITFTIEDSRYSTTGQRDAMLGAAVRSFQNAATGKNCNNVTWVEESAKPCPKSKRDLWGREVIPDPYTCSGQSYLCNGPNLISMYKASISPFLSLPYFLK